MKIISEIGINHNGDFRKMEELIRQSSIGGADYAKFQLYNSVRVFGDESRKKNEFTFNQVKTLKEICDYYNIEFFASVFDEEKLEWCKDIGVNLYKIASIGIKFKKWISFHGFSFNLSPNLEHYSGINPCGLNNKNVTSLSDIGIEFEKEMFDEIIIEEINNVFAK